MVQRKATWGAKTIATTGEAMAKAMLKLAEQEREIGRLRHHVSMLSKIIHRLKKFGEENEGVRKEKEEVAPSPELPVAVLPTTRRVGRVARKAEADEVARVAPGKEMADVAQVAPVRKVEEVARVAPVRVMTDVAHVAPIRMVDEVAHVAPRKVKEVIEKVARVPPSQGKRVASEDEGDRRGGETGWKVITRENKKRLVEKTPGSSEPGVDRVVKERVGFVFKHVNGCENTTPEKDEFMRGVLDRVKAKRTHTGVIRMLMKGRGCTNCTFGWRDGDEMWFPGSGD
ncbi:hypothetical protein HOY82DRAFT_538021 [Tuber indicum]|nr:hypothetical protein HOY82DRAFT_538021 [Tuber indicum]